MNAAKRDARVKGSAAESDTFNPIYQDESNATAGTVRRPFV